MQLVQALGQLRAHNLLPVVAGNLVVAIPKRPVQNGNAHAQRGQHLREPGQYGVCKLCFRFRLFRHSLRQLLGRRGGEVAAYVLGQDFRQLFRCGVNVCALRVGDAEAAAHDERLAVDIKRFGGDKASLAVGDADGARLALRVGKRGVGGIDGARRLQQRVVGRPVIAVRSLTFLASRQPEVRRNVVGGRCAFEYAQQRGGVEQLLFFGLRRGHFDAECGVNHVRPPKRFPVGSDGKNLTVAPAGVTRFAPCYLPPHMAKSLVRYHSLRVIPNE